MFKFRLNKKRFCLKKEIRNSYIHSLKSSENIKILLVLAVFLFLGNIEKASAQSSLFYFELQGVAGYSFSHREIHFFSLHEADPMQKPSAGFDFLKRFSSKRGDLGFLSLQARISYDQKGERPFAVQLFNAYIKLKSSWADIWLGHNRPSLGLSYTLDSHGLLLAPPAMSGVGFDLDWGAGLSRDFTWGEAALSLTTGTGMRFEVKNKLLAAMRVALGVQARDNYSLGFSLTMGRLEMMHLQSEDPAPSSWQGLALDGTLFWLNFESRGEILIGRAGEEAVALFFFRQSINLLDENRLKLEFQPVFKKQAKFWRTQFAGGLSFQVTADLTARIMMIYEPRPKQSKLAFQLYYYKVI